MRLDRGEGHGELTPLPSPDEPADVVGVATPDQRREHEESGRKRRRPRNRVLDFVQDVLVELLDVVIFWRR